MNDLTPLQEFAKALASFQAEIPNVGKDQTATVKSDKGQYSYSFADLTKITDRAFPLLSKHGFAWMVMPSVKEGDFGLVYKLMHVGGHVEEGFYPIPKGTAQQTGSAITYGRRYCLCAATGIAPGGEDDDGARASEVQPQTRQSNGNESVNVRARIWNIAKARGWEPSDVEADYSRQYGGGQFRDADADDLSSYLALLENGVAS